jgi:glycosyltransferase involved in cell wall biosynthesis
MKFALISNVLPPSESAHAAIIFRLLNDLSPETYCLLSSTDYTNNAGPNYTGRLSGKYYYLQPPFEFAQGYRFGLAPLRKRINLLLGVPLRASTISRILKQEKCDAVVVCTGGREILDFPAAYLASRITGVRFYAYLLDQYSHMVSYVLGNSFLRRFEARVLKGAAAVITPNEFLRDDLRKRFNIEPVLIHNMCDLSAYADANMNSSRDKSVDDEVSIVYTGGIGPLHYDAFRNLTAALELAHRANVRLHLYTAQPRDAIESEGIGGPNVVYHEHEPTTRMPAIQSQADILFLSLAFNSPYPEIVRTAQPGKMGEYLASGKPILVHAPAESFIAWYFRFHECGVVVDHYNPTKLAEAIELILDDASLRKKIGDNARKRASADFDHVKERARFFELIHGKA